ncbi:MAG TPA: 2Fe-2S iron-sulfur cluster-binding protein [Actinocrinis sp.]|nr:2Fe-2S iron-sulfur cluster-binding protein [Actinocrinis sp.]
MSEPGVHEPGVHEPDVHEPGAPDPSAVEWATAGYELTINGTAQPVADAWIGESLLFVLRERLGFTAVKDGCGEGECGACTILMDGQPTAACLVPAAAATGRAIETPELHAVPQPDPVARALAAHAGAGCGFCLPGIGMEVRALLERNAKPSAAAIREALSGHRCRCLPPERFIASVDEAANALARERAQAQAQAEALTQTELDAQAQPLRESQVMTSVNFARVPAQGTGPDRQVGDHGQTGILR